MNKVNAVCQAPYPFATPSGMHLLPGEQARIDRTPDVEEAFVTGLLREVPEAPKTERTPRAASARDENQE